MSDKSKRKHSTIEIRRRFLLSIVLLLVFVILTGLLFLGLNLNRNATEEATATRLAELNARATSLANFILTDTLDNKILSATPTDNLTFESDMFRVTASAEAVLTSSATLLHPTQQVNCFFNWAYNKADEQYHAQAAQLLTDAGFSDFSITLPAYGEDNICMQGDVEVSRRFGLMDISPQINLQVDPAIFADHDALGAKLETIINLMAGASELPKINRLEITFQTQADSLSWSMALDQAITALEQGVQGAAWFDQN